MVRGTQEWPIIRREHVTRWMAPWENQAMRVRGYFFSLIRMMAMSAWAPFLTLSMLARLTKETSGFIYAHGCGVYEALHALSRQTWSYKQSSHSPCPALTRSHTNVLFVTGCHCLVADLRRMDVVRQPEGRKRRGDESKKERVARRAEESDFCGGCRA